MQRAKDAGCSALVITLDLQVLGQRHKDLKNGLSAPPKITAANFLDMATKWAWGIEMLSAQRRNFGNIVGHVDGVSDMSKLSSWVGEQFDLQLNWDDVKRIKDWWGDKLIIKGILDADDAEMAAKSGAEALIVSNHVGRQLDGAESSIAILPEIVDRVGQDIEIWMDGGIR